MSFAHSIPVTAHDRSLQQRGAWRALLFLAVSLVNLLLLWHFHDRYWYPTDDGFYAHIAERLLAGEVLNRDVQDIHPGYIHVVHVLAFRLFGTDMVSLRYPLMLVAFIQACVVYALLQRRSTILAAAGSLAVTGLGVIQFVDPTPNWYCLCLCIVLACWMMWLPHGHPARLIGAGLLAGVLTLFRHLNGVWVVMAVLVLAMLEHSSAGRREHSVFLARALLLTMLTALVGYLVLSPETEPGGLVLMAAWPIAILTWMLVYVRASNADVGSIVARVALGAAVPTAPLILYHVLHGSFIIWVSDIVLAAIGELDLPFYGRGWWYFFLSQAGFFQAVTSVDPVIIANGLYWTILPLLSAINGLFIFVRLRRGEEPRELILPVLASFYALNSLLFEGHLYLYYTVGLSLVSLLWFAAAGSRLHRWGWAATAGALAVISVVFHAGQSRERTVREILEGRRVSNVWSGDAGGLDRCDLRLDQVDRDVYGRFVRVIHAETRADETIFALPNDAELYFLANRRNPFRFYNSALGIRTDDDLRHVMTEMRAHPPRLVIFRPDDKYNNAASARVMSLVKSEYVLIDTIDGRDLYRLP